MIILNKKEATEIAWFLGDARLFSKQFKLSKLQQTIQDKIYKEYPDITTIVNAHYHLELITKSNKRVK